MPWKHVVAPTKGLVTNLSPTGISSQASPYMSGVILKDGEISSDFGMTNFPVPGPLKTNALNGTLMRIDQFFLLNGTSYLIALTTAHLYAYNTTTTTWDVYTQGTEIDDCESAWTASDNVVSTRATVAKLRGTYSAEHVISAAYEEGTPAYAHFKCNDNAASTVATDDGTGGNNGVASTNTTNLSVAGKINQAFDLVTANSEYIDCSAVVATIVNDTVGTITAWHYPKTDNIEDVILAFGDKNGNTSIRLYYQGSDHTIKAVCSIGGITQWACTSSADSSPKNTDTHVMFTHDSTAPKIYINNVEDTTFTSEGDKTVWLKDLTGVDTFCIGAVNNIDSVYYFYEGEIDDVRYYREVVSSETRTAIYNSGSGTENTVQGDVISYNNTLDNTDISDAKHTHLSFWARSSKAIAAGVLALRLSEQTGGGTGATYADYNIPALVIDTWQHVSLAVATPDADSGDTYPDDLGALASVALIMNTDPGIATIHIDDIRAVKAFTGDEDNKWSTAVSNDKMGLSNGVDLPSKLTNAGGLVHSDMALTLPTGSLTTCEVMIPFKDHMLYFNNTENGGDAPQRCSWSNIGDIEDLVAGTAGFQDLLDDDSWVVGAAMLSENEIAVYKERSIIQCTWVGGHTPFRFRTIIVGTGAINKDCIAEMGSGHTVLGPDVTFEYTGVNEINVIDDSVKRTMYSRMDGAYMDRAFLMSVEEDDELQIWVPANATTPDEGYTFNTVGEQWYIKDRNISGYGYYQEQSSLTIGDLVGTIGEQNWTFGSQLTKKYFPITLVGDSGGKIYKLDKLTLNNVGVAIVNEFQTPDFVLPGVEEYMNYNMRVYQLIIEAKGQMVTTFYSTDGGATWAPTQGAGTNVISLDSIYNEYEQFFETDAKRIRFKFYNASLSSGFYIRHYAFLWQQRTGRR